ncbi:alpha/beta fold hydrolase [Kaarinaea lacus]
MLFYPILRNLILLGALFISVIGCGGSGGDTPTQTNYQRGDYVAANQPITLSSSDINTALDNAVGLINVSALYDVRLLKLTYKTIDPDGNLTTASGVVAYPLKNTTSTSPLLSLQHGTIYLDSAAPSNESLIPFSLYKTSIHAVIAASTGYLVVAPDYLGYGDSTVEVHPYMHADSLATSVIDLILASRQYFAYRNIRHNGQVFLAGYSEGGYATLAAHKILQEEYNTTITVSASAPGAGAYNISETALDFASGTQLTAPDNVAFVMKAYDTIYDLNRLSDFFQPAYVDFVDNAFFGDTSRDTIALELPSAPTDLFNSVFLQAFTSDGETELKALFQENDIYNWQPEAPTYFFHGRDDNVVPYLNMESVMNTMQDNLQVSFTTCIAAPADHANCFLPYMQFAIDSFSAIAEDL